MNTCFLSFISVDPSLGKVEKHLLSQQTLMELFSENIKNKKVIYGSKECQENVSDWKGLKCNDCREIKEISWIEKGLKGSISLEWLPFSVTEVYIQGNKLTGTVDLTCLPDGLECLSLGGNWFYGRVDLTKLPEKMTGLVISWNNFSGKTNFSQLPKSLNHLNVMFTQLEGEIHEFSGRLRVENSNFKDMRKK